MSTFGYKKWETKTWELIIITHLLCSGRIHKLILFFSSDFKCSRKNVCHFFKPQTGKNFRCRTAQLLPVESCSSHDGEAIWLCRSNVGRAVTLACLGLELRHGLAFEILAMEMFVSKNFPTDPWSIPQTPNQQFMKEFLSFGGLGMSGVCSRGMLGFP